MTGATATDSLKNGVSSLMGILEHWEDIVVNARELEKALKPELMMLTNDTEMYDIKNSINAVLDSIQAQLNVEASDLNTSLAGLGNTVRDVLGEIQTTLNIDFSTPLNMNQMPTREQLREFINDFIPTLDCVDLTALTSRIDGLAGLFSFPEFSLGIEHFTVAQGPSTQPDAQTGPEPENTVKDPLSESSGDEWLKILPDFAGHQQEIEDFFRDIHAAVEASPLLADLEGQLSSFNDFLTNVDTLSAEDFLLEITGIVKNLIPNGFALMRQVLELFFDGCTSVFSVTLGEMTKPLPSDHAMTALLKGMMGEEDPEPSFLTLTCLLMSVPYTLTGLATSASSTQEFSSSKRAYGTFQILDGLAIATSIINDYASRRAGWKGHLSKLELPDLSSVAWNILAQESSRPGDDSNHLLSTQIWRYQWYQGVAWPAFAYIINLTNNLGKHWSGFETFDTIDQILTMVNELCHFLLFIFLGGMEDNDSEPRQDDRVISCYYIDPIASFLDSFAEIFLISRVEPEERSEKLAKSVNALRGFVVLGLQSAYGGLYIDTHANPAVSVSIKESDEELYPGKTLTACLENIEEGTEASFSWFRYKLKIKKGGQYTPTESDVTTDEDRKDLHIKGFYTDENGNQKEALPYWFTVKPSPSSA